MHKIPTIFVRAENGGGVLDQPVVDPAILVKATPTEKVDGTNVRITVRSHQIVRVEKRRNPTKLQKQQDILHPWYVDADEYDSADKYIYQAVYNYVERNQKDGPNTGLPDGEWSAEAVGPKIQGNPLDLEKHELIVFSAPWAVSQLRMEGPENRQFPVDFDALHNYLRTARSKFNESVPPEGIVWWKDGQPIGKIKLKDYK